MVIGLLQMDLRVPDSQSLKAKRQVLLGLKSRIRQRFNVSVSETEHQDKWQLATLAVACVGTDRAGVDECLSRLTTMVEREPDVEVVGCRLESL